MTPEEFDAWMLDTSDAPKPGDPIPEDNNNKGNTEGSSLLDKTASLSIIYRKLNLKTRQNSKLDNIDYI